MRIVAQVRGKLKRSVLHTLSMAQLWSLLTSPACEVLDVTFAPNLGSARTREQCAALVIYQPDNQIIRDPMYHPTLVGPDFFYHRGGIL